MLDLLFLYQYKRQLRGYLRKVVLNALYVKGNLGFLLNESIVGYVVW